MTKEEYKKAKAAVEEYDRLSIRRSYLESLYSHLTVRSLCS